MFRDALVIIALLLVVACGGGGDDEIGGSGGNTGNTINGTFELNSYDSTKSPNHEGYCRTRLATCPAWQASSFSCQGNRGFDDIRQGAQVIVRDGSSAIIATGELGEGISQDDSANCVFEFTILNVPLTDFYTVEVSHRGEIAFAKGELEAKGWQVALTLGD